jgi:hypothetical protein
MASLPRNRLMFTLQSGSPATLKKHNVLRAFLRFGDVDYLFYETGFTFGWVQFKSDDSYAKASNLLLPIITPTDLWELHTFKDFNMAKPPKDAFSRQILLESKELPTSWENLIIVKEFFKKYHWCHKPVQGWRWDPEDRGDLQGVHRGRGDRWHPPEDSLLHHQGQGCLLYF